MTETVWVFDFALGRHTYISPSHAAMLGQPLEDVYADPGAWLRLVAPEDQARMRESFAEKTSSTADFRVIRDDGVELHIATCITPVLGPDGQPQALIGICRDVTAKRQLKRESEALAGQWRALTEVCQDAVVTTNGQGIILSWNRGAEQIFQLPASAAVGRHMSQMVGEAMAPEQAELVRRAVAAADAGELTQAQVGYGVRADGTRFPCEVMVSRWVQPDNQAQYTGIIRDVSRQRAMEAHIRHAQKLEVLGRVASEISHDFNNMMAAIQAFADVVQDALPPNSDAVTAISEIRRAVDSSSKMTRKLLGFARREDELTERLALDAFVRESLPLLRQVVGPRTLVEFIAEEGDYAVTGNRNQLQQVLVNLAINARDAMPEGGTLRLRVQPAVHRGCKDCVRTDCGATVTLFVEDTGEGIDPAIARHVFDPFYSTKSGERGTGLGLSSVYSIVQQHHGFVDFESTVGKGTCFRVCLPHLSARVSSSESEARVR